MSKQYNSGIEYMLENPDYADKFIEMVNLQNLPSAEDFKNSFFGDLTYYSQDKVGRYIPNFIKNYMLKSLISSLSIDVECMYKLYNDYNLSLDEIYKRKIEISSSALIDKIKQAISQKQDYQEIYWAVKDDFDVLFLQLHILNSKVNRDVCLLSL